MFSKQLSIFFCIFLSLAKLSTIGYAQEKIYKQFTKKDGLAGNTVYAMSQDKDGFIWFGTENGASRFDGSTFTNFTTEDGLTDNEVVDIYSDAHGRTWFICFAGSICYYYKGKIFNYKTDSLISPDILPIKIKAGNRAEDRNGTVWFLESYYGYNPKQPSITRNCIKNYNLEAAQPLFFTKDNVLRRLQVNLGDSAIVCDEMNRVIYPIQYLLGATPIKKLLISAKHQKILHVSFENKWNEIFIQINNQICNYEIVHNRVALKYQNKFPFVIKRIQAIPNSHQYWITGAERVVYKLNEQLQIIDSITNKAQISSVLNDKWGNFWLTSLIDGVYFQSKSKINFYPNLPQQIVNTLAKIPNGNILLGYNDGNLRQYQTTSIQESVLVKATTCCAGEKIMDIKVIGNDEIVCSANKHISSIKNNQIKNYISKGSIKGISVRNKNQILYVSNLGFYKLDITSGADSAIILNKRMTAISDKGSVGDFYVAGIDSLYHVDSNLKVKAVAEYDVKKYGRIIGLHQLTPTKLIVLTYNYGLVYIDGNRMQILNKDNGLLSNQCRKMYIENDSIFWVLTEQSISKITYTISKQSFAVKNFTEADGFSTNSFHSICKIGKLIFIANDQGLYSFDEQDMASPNDHSVEITSFLVNSKHIELDTNTIKVRHGDKISIEYKGISMANAGLMTYEYILKGSNQPATKSRLNNIEFYNLSPGEYYFNVFAINKEGEYAAKSSSIRFIVLPLFWETWYFKCFLLAIVFGLIIFLFRYRLLKLKQQEDEKTKINKQFAELKLQAVRAQMNPHFIFNCLNSIQHYNINEDYTSAQKFLSEFAKLIRQTLNHSQQDFGSLAEELQLIETYIKLEKLRFEEKFSYSIHLDKHVENNKGRIIVPSLLFQPYIENAINHGLKYLKEINGTLDICFTIEQNKLIVLIEDDGIGIRNSKLIKQHEEHQSHGLKINQSYVDVINKIHGLDIKVEIKEKSPTALLNPGTQIKIILPLQLK